MPNVVAVVHNIVQALLDIMCMTYLIYNKLFMPYLSSADFLKIFLGPPRGFGDLGRMAIYFQGAGEHW